MLKAVPVMYCDVYKWLINGFVTQLFKIFRLTNLSSLYDPNFVRAKT